MAQYAGGVRPLLSAGHHCHRDLLLIGYPLSYFLAQERSAVRRVAMMLIMLPMWMNFLLRTYSWMFLLERNG